MLNCPILSIIIPVYNVEAYVGQTLTSVFDTIAPEETFEVIVVNDGTKDGSMDVVQRFADRPNIKIVEQENQGLSAARMRGADVAQGKYVWFIDSDDWLEKDGVQLVLSILEDRSSADVLMFPLRWRYEDEGIEKLDYVIDGEKMERGCQILLEMALPVWASQRFVIKRSLIDGRWLFFPKGVLHEDEYFGPVLMCLAERVVVLKDPVYNYRLRPGSITSGANVRSSYAMVSIHKYLIDFMEETMSSEEKYPFRQYCFGRLLTSYTRYPELIGSREFDKFAHKDGFYVWRQWRIIHRQRPFFNKLGRLFFFMMPGLWKRIVGWDGSVLN